MVSVTPRRLYPRERNPISKEEEAGWAQSRSLLLLEVTKPLRICRDSNTGPSGPQRSHYTDFTVSAHSSVFLCHCLSAGSDRPDSKSKNSLSTCRQTRKYTRSNRAINEVSVMLTTNRVTVRFPGQIHQAPIPEDQVTLQPRLRITLAYENACSRYVTDTNTWQEKGQFVFGLPNNVGWRVQIIKLFVMKLYAPSCYTTAHTHAGIFMEYKILANSRQNSTET